MASSSLQGTFAVRVRGESMVGPPGTRSYPDGCTIIVDPSREAKPGARVVVRLNDSGAETFRQLEFDGSVYSLRPLNPDYPVMEMPDKAQILGVVVQTLIDEVNAALPSGVSHG